LGIWEAGNLEICKSWLAKQCKAKQRKAKQGIWTSGNLGSKKLAHVTLRESSNLAVCESGKQKSGTCDNLDIWEAGNLGRTKLAHVTLCQSGKLEISESGKRKAGTCDTPCSSLQNPAESCGTHQQRDFRIGDPERNSYGNQRRK